MSNVIFLLYILLRKLYFTLVHKNPVHGKICTSPAGCQGSGSDVSNRGAFYVPTEKGEKMALV